MKRWTILNATLLALAVLVNVWGMTTRYAGATVPSKPYTFVGGTLAQSAQVNADFDPIYSVLNGLIDHSNMQAGTGIYASDIKPPSSAAATFGGGLTYTMPGLVVQNLPVSADVCTDTASTLVTCPIYNFAGTQLTNKIHEVLAYVGTTEGCPSPYTGCTVNVTLSGNAAFTNGYSYTCNATWNFDGTKNPPTALWVETVSGSSFLVNANFSGAPSGGSYTFPIHCKGY